MKRTKTSAKKNTQEEGSSQREKQRPKKWDKSDTTHYNNMKKVAVPATQLACPETMTILGIKSDIEGLFQNMGLGQLCNLNEPTYPELVRQFIASAYVSHPNDSHQEGFLAFVVQKVYFE
uniref:Arabidopsis retrotransposon Orf1 C-terminal domain-containing protein n=1 Tax=Brassica oleracea var. oleracea TaxID=109376 RepID=A0A0D2ZXS1_BRAOL